MNSRYPVNIQYHIKRVVSKIMKVKKIEYLHPVRDLVNDCLDVFVTLEDNSNYLVEITTPEFLIVLMEKGTFLPPQYPYIIVSKLTEEIIQTAIQEFIDAEADSYWLKLYHLAPTLKIEEINEILDRKEKEFIELELKIDTEMKTENQIILERVSFLGLAGLISYCFMKVGLFDVYSNFIN